MASELTESSSTPNPEACDELVSALLTWPTVLRDHAIRLRIIALEIPSCAHSEELDSDCDVLLRDTARLLDNLAASLQNLEAPCVEE